MGLTVLSGDGEKLMASYSSTFWRSARWAPRREYKLNGSKSVRTALSWWPNGWGGPQSLWADMGPRHARPISVQAGEGVQCWHSPCAARGNAEDKADDAAGGTGFSIFLLLLTFLLSSFLVSVPLIYDRSATLSKVLMSEAS
jgi:hypothetical protein